MAIEAKASASNSNHQKAKKQLLDAKGRIEEIITAIGSTTRSWLFGAVFYATEESHGNFNINENSTADSIFSIIGAERIEENMRLIDEKAIHLNKNWSLSDHVEEFVELAKRLFFIVQGDPKAPVTGSNMIDKIVEHVTKAAKFENLMFWTPEQLGVINALLLPFIFLDAFYSTGKSSILQYITKHWSQETGKCKD